MQERAAEDVQLQLWDVDACEPPPHQKGERYSRYCFVTQCPR
ncbi:MAG: hypothetical protein ACUVTY_13150 [Armatimonadota bacterium]